MTIRLYDLAGADAGLRFSPHCWKVRMALAHKGLAHETMPWRFTDTDAIAFSGQGKVPVLRDGDEVVSDSFEIACFIERRYPRAPSLFGGPQGEAVARFVNAWADATLLGPVGSMVLADIERALADADRDYFRRSREARFGDTLENVQAGREQRLPAFRASLTPLRLTLKRQPFLAGEAPNYADYCAFGAFQWARCVSAFELLADDDPVHGWRERLLDAHGGLARAALVGY
ncbi:MAG: glutathione S-transferase family protein [Burkholderiaceae bacterium]